VVAARVKEGHLRPIAVLGHARVPQFPDVPTAAEAGLPDLTSYTWSGIVAPAATPPQIVEVLNDAMQSVLSEIETQARFLKAGMIPERSTPEQLRRFIVAELTKWSRAVPLSATVPTAGK
jgi:tripartite-type tricarboxylate transporter receptor subunit TctC